MCFCMLCASLPGVSYVANQDLPVRTIFTKAVPTFPFTVNRSVEQYWNCEFSDARMAHRWQLSDAPQQWIAQLQPKQ